MIKLSRFIPPSIVRNSKKIFWGMGLVFLGLLPIAFAEKIPEVLIVLGVHGSAESAPHLIPYYAEQFIKVTEETLQKSKRKQEEPLVIWFENALPESLFYSLSRTKFFFEEIENRTGIPSIEFQELLLQPHRYSSRDVKKSLRILKSIFKQHESKSQKKSLAAEAGPKVFKNWILKMRESRPVEIRYEKFVFQAWLEALKSMAWDIRMFEEILAGDMEAAMKSRLGKGISASLSYDIRDRRLAEDITRSQKSNSEAQHIVIRGAAHERLGIYLQELGTASRNIYQIDSNLITGASAFWTRYASTANLFSKEFRLSGEERDYLARALIFELHWKYLLKHDPEIFSDMPRMQILKAAVEMLSFQDLEAWMTLIQSEAGDLDVQAQVSWNWIIEKAPGLER